MANLNTLYKKYSNKFNIEQNRIQNQIKRGEDQIDMVIPFKYTKEQFKEVYERAKERLELDFKNAKKDYVPSENAILKKVIEIQKFGSVSKLQARHLQKMMLERENINITYNEALRGVVLASGLYPDMEPKTENEKKMYAYGIEQSEYNTQLKLEGYDSYERAKRIGQVFHGSP